LNYTGRLLFLCLCLAGAGRLYAQPLPDLLFEHITIRDGLSNNNVTAFGEDSYGFMWVGTANGLNRFDGYRFRHFYHSNTDSNSLVNNAVQTIHCDRKKRIWIATEDGVSCYNPATNQFTNYNSRFRPGYRLRNNSSVRIYEDESGTILLSNQQGYIMRVLPDLRLQEIPLIQPSFLFMGSETSGYSSIARDRDGQEWAVTANRIYQLNPKDRQVAQTFDFASRSTLKFLSLYQAADKNYYGITWGSGIWQFNPKTGTILPVGDIGRGITTAITEWTYGGKKRVVVLEVNAGLYIQDTGYHSWQHVGVIPGDPTSLQGSVFNSIFVDSRGTLWVASNQGICRINNGQAVMRVIPITGPGEINFAYAANGSVYALFDDGGKQWISKRFLSTLVYDSNARLLHNYYSFSRMTEKPGVYADGYAYYFLTAGEHLYISTDSGLVMLDRSRRKSKNFFPPQAPVYTSFRTMIDLGNGDILIRSFDRGIFRFNTVQNKFTGYYSNSDTCKACLPAHINYLFRSHSGEIYLTTSGAGKGLFRFNTARNRFEPLRAANDSVFGMQGSDLFGMDEDRNGRLWITSSNGLFVYDVRSNRIITQHNENDQVGGLSRICFDRFGNAWANGTGGIWCYDIRRRQWIGFNGQDGLPGGDYGGVITQDRNGAIVSGLEGAIAVFDPSLLVNPSSNAASIITEAAVANQVISFTPDTSRKQLTLHPGEHSFSVDFAVLNYDQPFATRYYYKLAPLADAYRENNDGHINISGLSPGHYTLYVRGGDKAGNMFSHTDILHIYVQPAWYQTTFFRVLAALVLAALILLFLRRRIRQVRKEAGLRQKIAETETMALRAQMNPHFIFNSLNSIENFIMLNEKRLASDYLNKFSRLIRSILDSSRNEIVPLHRDLASLRLYVELEQLRFDHKFRFEVDADPQLLQGDYKVPSLLVQPYLENAIVHGIAHSERDDLVLSLGIQLTDEAICYTITDNGVGRMRAGEYNRENKPGHKSVGLQITSDRIAHFNLDAGITDAIRFTDLYTPDGHPAGTKVEVRIKIL